MIQLTQTAGALFGVLAVVLGAFGAHALKKVFTPELQQSFETGVRYQMYHALLLILINITLSFETSIEKTVAYLIIIGTLLFSFSIYGLCLSSAFGKKWKWLGPITPLGGLLLTLGWTLLAFTFISN